MTALTALTGGDLAAWIRLAAETVSAHTDELTALDAAIGDADHGANMRRGMDAAASAVDDLEAGGAAPAPDVVLKKVAMTLISTIGGASGPLYGTFFLRASTACAGVEALDTPTLATAVEAGVAGIAQRGRSVAGEKTMLDAWYPALAALQSGGSLVDAVGAGAREAAAGRDATKDLVATKGRASYLGERSVGHIDPGAASTALLLEALDAVVRGGSGADGAADGAADQGVGA